MSTRITISRGGVPDTTLTFTDSNEEGQQAAALLSAAVEQHRPFVRLNGNNGSFGVDLTDVTGINIEQV